MKPRASSRTGCPDRGSGTATPRRRSARRSPCATPGRRWRTSTCSCRGHLPNTTSSSTDRSRGTQAVLYAVGRDLPGAVVDGAHQSRVVLGRRCRAPPEVTAGRSTRGRRWPLAPRRGRSRRSPPSSMTTPGAHLAARRFGGAGAGPRSQGTQNEGPDGQADPASEERHGSGRAGGGAHDVAHAVRRG